MQIAAQDEVKNLETSVKHLEANLKSIADKNEKVRLNWELENTKNNLSTAQSLLKNKVVASRKFRNLLSLNDAKLVAEVRKLNLMPPGQFTPSSSLNNTETSASEKAPGTPDSIIPVSKNQMLKPDETLEKNKSVTRNQSLTPECIFQVGGDRKKTALEPEILFTYTPEELKKHLKGIPHSKGWAFIAREPGYILLQLNMEIASRPTIERIIAFSTRQRIVAVATCQCVIAGVARQHVGQSITRAVDGGCSRKSKIFDIRAQRPSH